MADWAVAHGITVIRCRTRMIMTGRRIRTKKLDRNGSVARNPPKLNEISRWRGRFRFQMEICAGCSGSPKSVGDSEL